MPDDNSPLLSLRSPWPQPDPREMSLSSLIPRILVQRGHFKDVNESILEAEIAANEVNDHSRLERDSFGIATVTQDEPEHVNNEQVEGSEEEAEVDRATQLKNAKLEMTALVGNALNEALFAVDYVSLLVSLQAPEVGSTSMSPALKSAVPVGSMGFDRIQHKVSEKTAKEDAVTSRTWKAEALNSAADALLTASLKLGAEVEKEAKYWQQVLAIRDDGWLITRMPRERNTLGVRYGFAEAAPEYKSKGISALRRGEDGSVIVENVAVSSSRSKATLRVRILKNSEVVGMSVQSGSELSRTLKDTIESARNFVYEDELFFEIMREARVLASQGIRTSEDAVTIELGRGKKVVLDMAPLDVETLTDAPRPLSDFAQGIAIALRLLLSYNHRVNLKNRSKPPAPLTSRKVSPQSLFLIRPITTHVYHQQHLEDLQHILDKLQNCAVAAGLSSKFSITPLKNCRNNDIQDVKSAVEMFLTALETEGAATFPGDWKLTIAMRTMLGPPLFGTGYIVNASHDGVAAKLMGETRFYSVDEMQLYLCWCLERSIVNEIRFTGEWKQEAQSNEMTRAGGDKKACRIRIEVNGQGLGLSWSSSGRSDSYTWDGNEHQVSLLDVLGGI